MNNKLFFRGDLFDSMQDALAWLRKDTMEALAKGCTITNWQFIPQNTQVYVVYSYTVAVREMANSRNSGTISMKG